MKKILVATVAALAIMAAMQPVAAADMRVKAPIYKAPIVDPWSWSGFYVGLNVGYSWGRSATDASLRNNTTNALLFTAGPGVDLDGWIGGGQIGYNWQVATWVFGLEADLQASGQKGGTSIACGVLICNPLADTFDTNVVRATLDQRLAWFGTVRARLGAALAPTVLAYVTGGLAYGRIDSDGTFSGFTVGGLATSNAFSSSTTKAGWTVGAGLEARLGGNWTGKIEYLYVDLGSIETSTINTLMAPPVRLSFDSHITDNILRLGINYKFDWGPVVAKY